MAAASFELMDPLSVVLAPPIGETPEQRELRIARENHAKQVSDAIDEEIEAQRQADKRMKPVKILLLGQSESGKSTTLKNFQLMYEPAEFHREKASWRAVIQLNLVRSFHLIFEAFTRHQQGASLHHARGHITIPPELLKCKLRLVPLLAIEEALIRRLTPVGSGETEATQRDSPKSAKAVLKEVAVNSANHWKEAFNRAVKQDSVRGSFETQDWIDWDDPKDPGRVLHECSDDMVKLWEDPITQALLEKENIHMEEIGGFFLDQIERITAPRYIPTDDDVLRARLKTLGVSEHRFTLRSNAGAGELGRDWRVFDVGGHRSQRAAWIPYFDDMDSIIFLAPISCFDQVLVEDPRTNRLADSVSLWTSICQNQLLKNTNLILFLNKIDIFKAKLAAGVMFSDYIVSYGGRANDFETTTNYLRRKFGGILKDNSPVSRVFYSHLTTMTDMKSTQYILINLREMLMRDLLVKTKLVV